MVQLSSTYGLNVIRTQLYSTLSRQTYTIVHKNEVINKRLPSSLQHVSLDKLCFHRPRTRLASTLRKSSCLCERGMTMRACAFTIFQKAKMAATSQYRRISQHLPQLFKATYLHIWHLALILVQILRTPSYTLRPSKRDLFFNSSLNLRL